ncbi:MAG TPA: PTS fructose transporter subunit IIA [Sphaerochaeta sp.]|nr:PTS fructose transporter subunit IIA [Sphaerochaeta sp.]
MEGICKRLSTDCILLDLHEQDKEQIIRKLVAALHEAHHLSDPEKLLVDIMAREELASTCLGSGCAVPHAHSETLSTSLLAAARITPPADLETPDGHPISLVFLLVGPSKNTIVHLKLLSKLARLLHDEVFRNQLLASDCAEAFHALICKQEA